MSFETISFERLTEVVRYGEAALFAVHLRPQPRGMKVSDTFKKLIAEYGDIFVEELPDKSCPQPDLDFHI